MESNYKYYAFISHNEADEKWAKWLQNHLEYYHIPSALYKEYSYLPRKIRPVFWYKQDLSGTKLKLSLKQELEASKYLIVVCSPKAAKSSWVNDEVESFIQQGKEDRIIPFIVDGTPHAVNDEKECLPPALCSLSREEEIRGIDVHQQGKSHALVDIVATMLGLRKDVLLQRHEQRRKRIRNAWIVLCSLLMLFSIGIYDYTRTKVEYYADYVICKGMPKGIIPLTEKDINKRIDYYGFESSRRKLNRVLHYDYTGNVANHSNTAMTDRYAIQELVYENDVFSAIIMCDALGNPIYKESYNAPYYDRVDLKTEKGDASYLHKSYTSIFTQEDYQFNLDKLINSGNAKIGRYVLEYDDEGYIIRKLFKRYNGDNTHVGKDNNGVSGFYYVRDSLHRVKEQYYLDENKDIMEDKNGIAGRIYEYDVNGYISDEKFIDKEKRLVLNELLYAHGVYIHNTKDFTTEERFYDADDNATLNKYGSHRYKTVITKEFVENACFGCSNEPVLYWDVETGNGGFHVIRNYLDKRGRMIGVDYLGTDSLPIYNSLGFSSASVETDKDGLVTRFIAHDKNGKRCNTITGVCEITTKYQDGKAVENVFYDNRGKRINSLAGFSKVESNYKDGRLLERAYYDMNDMQIFSPEILGAHKLFIEYDDAGNAIGVFMYGLNNILMDCVNGFAYAKMKYDESGNCIEMATYNSDKELAMSKSKYAVCKSEYNSDGTLRKLSFFNEKMEATLSIAGSAVEEYEYDKFGLQTECRYYNEVYQLKNNRSGCAIIRKNYQNNRLISMATFDENDNPISTEEGGCHKALFKYNDRGYLVSSTSWGVDGEPMISTVTGCWKYERDFNARGQVIKESCYDVNGELINNRFGVAFAINEYTEQGKISKQFFYDKYKNLTINKVPNMGYAYCESKYNERGQAIDIKCFGINNEPINNNFGIHHIKNIYNSDANLLVMAYYDKDKKLCNGQINGYTGAIWKFIYDKEGRNCFNIIFGEDMEEVYAHQTYWDNFGNVDKYLWRNNELFYEVKNTGEWDSFSVKYYGTDEAIQQYRDSLNQVFDSLKVVAKTLYE